MRENRLIRIIDEHTSNYLNKIAIELEESHDNLIDNFGFPIFANTSKEANEQVYFQSYLESYTRKMINHILKDIFDEEIAEEIIWPEFDYPGSYQGYTNKECECEFVFEFKNLDTKVGYRYTSLDIEEIDDVLNNSDVDSIVFVVWENKESSNNFCFSDKPAKYILLWDLFHELDFDMDENEIDSMYEIFTKKVSQAVGKAIEMISLSTVPGFTPTYLFKERENIINDMRKTIRSLSCFYVNENDYRYVEENSKTLINEFKMHHSFLNKGYEYALVGTSQYAKSFLTSEYLYHYFKRNPISDFTPIVSGYIKSIEQLIHIIDKGYLDYKNIEKDLSKCSMGQYINAFDKNSVFKVIFSNEYLKAKQYIIDCLNRYLKEIRNKVFHKDYLNTWKEVEQIRNNTVFLYVILLGPINNSIINNNPSILGILDSEYDRMFFILDKQNNYYYSFVLNGQEYSEMWKQRRSNGLYFNENGLVLNSIKFISHKYDCDDTIEVSREKMPSVIWITDSMGKNKRVIWPIQIETE